MILCLKAGCGALWQWWSDGDCHGSSCFDDYDYECVVLCCVVLCLLCCVEYRILPHLHVAKLAQSKFVLSLAILK